MTKGFGIIVDCGFYDAFTECVVNVFKTISKRNFVDFIMRKSSNILAGLVFSLVSVSPYLLRVDGVCFFFPFSLSMM